MACIGAAGRLQACDGIKPADRVVGGIAELRRIGARDVTVLDARTPREVEARGVTAALERARDVWLVGGRQGRCVDDFAGTRPPEILRNGDRDQGRRGRERRGIDA